MRKYRADTIRYAFKPWFVGEESEDGEQRSFCPICEDPQTSKSPSAMFNIAEGIWNCLKGNHGGQITRLALDLKRERGWSIVAEAKANKLNEETSTSASNSAALKEGGCGVTIDDVRNWNKALHASRATLSRLVNGRGLTIETIDKYLLGWDGSRVTIPVWDVDGEIVNVRRYSFSKNAVNKMLNIKGHGTARIYLPDVLAANQKIVLCEGEFDCLVLNQAGIPAVTGTGGCKTFKNNWPPLFAGRDVYLCFDRDEEGRAAAQRVARKLKTYAKSIHTVVIPLDHRGADVTDYMVHGLKSPDDFRQLMLDAEVFVSGQGGTVSRAGHSYDDSQVADFGKRVTLAQSVEESRQGEVLEMVVSVTGRQHEPYAAPRVLYASCDQSKGAACTICPLTTYNGEVEKYIRADDPILFSFVDATDERRRKLMRELVGSRCSDRVQFDTTSFWYIEELLVQPAVDEIEEGTAGIPIRRPVFAVSSNNTGIQSKIKIVGRNVVDPASGRLRLLTWQNELVGLDIDRFILDGRARALLNPFRPKAGQSSLDRCLSIAHDMASSVTQIYGRDLLHVAYDLAWHSVLSLNVAGAQIQKGWIEMMVVGDTRTGKSEIAYRLQEHYRCGQITSCEGMSFAGIVGGVQQIDKRWHTTWGIVPMNDRRLVVLDEVSGMAEKNIIEQMSSIRSSGIAQITKISTEQTPARTRLIWITNPQDGSMLFDTQDAGMAALRSVVPNAEDQARFDYVVAAAKGEVPADVINVSGRSRTEPRYTSEMCEMLVKWAWSLKPDDIIVTSEAVSAAIEAARGIDKKYVPDPPLIQAENARLKILRIAAAIAARTFSEQDGRLIVDDEHVEGAVEFLDMIYTADAMAYSRHSRRRIQANKIARQRKQEIVAWLTDSPDALLTLQMVGSNTFRSRDFMEYGGMAPDEAHNVVKTLIQHRAAIRLKRGEMRMSSQLVAAIRQIEDMEEG